MNALRFVEVHDLGHRSVSETYSTLKSSPTSSISKVGRLSIWGTTPSIRDALDHASTYRPQMNEVVAFRARDTNQVVFVGLADDRP